MFTSLSSTDEEQHVGSNPVTHSPYSRNSGERHTWCDVSTLLNMRFIQPRAIAYMSVQVQTI